MIRSIFRKLIIPECALALFFLSFLTAGLAIAEGDEEESVTRVGEVTYPGTSPLIQNPHARAAMSLNGRWNVIVDKLNRGFFETLGYPYYTNRKPETGMELIEFSFDESNQLRVPGDWNTQRPELLFYDRAVWYQRTFEVNPKNERRYFLHFGGANFVCDVNLNGEKVGRHRGGYTSFNFEVTDLLVDGTNDLVIRVDAQLSPASVPTESIDWWPYGGLIRDVSLLEVPESYVRSYAIRLADGERSGIDAWVQVDGITEGTSVTLKVPDLKVEASGNVDASGRIEFQFRANPELWSPENPKLYDVEISNGPDTVRDRIGFRTIEAREGEVLLNGKPIFLRGISMHEESVLKEGIAFDPEDARAMLNIARELGVNFVRLAHYPHNEHIVRLADELGLLLWSEVPVYWDIQWANPETLELARLQVKEMIQRDLNRASIIIWSVANETPNTSSRLEFLKTLIRTAREEDGSRLVSAALLGDVRGYLQSSVSHLFKHNRATEESPAEFKELEFSIEDPLAEWVDIVSVNEYFGWYYSGAVARFLPLGEARVRELMLRSMPEFRFTNPYGKPMIISEFGAGAKAGFHSEEGKLWSEEYQARVYRQQIRMLDACEQVKGMSPWILKDFRSTMRPLNGIQDYFNRKGLIDERGQKKLAFDVLREYYAGKSRADGAPQP